MSFFGNTQSRASTAFDTAQRKKLLNINNDALNSNQQAVPVKYLAGRNYVAGDYLSPAYNPRAVPIQTQAGKGNSETTGYKYFADFALVFCMGGRRPVDAIRTIIVDSEIIWTGNVTRGNAQKEVITVPHGIIHLYWGSETQTIDSVLLSPRSTAIGGGNQQDSTTWPANAPGAGDTTFGGLTSGDLNPYSGHYDKHPAYRGQCYAVFKDWKLGRDRTSVPNIQFELVRGCPWFNGAFVAADDRGVNPAVFLFDLFTDTRFGAAFPEASLYSAGWIATYNALEAQSARISPTITSQTDFRNLVAQALEYFDGFVRRNGDKIELGLFTTTGNPVSAATLTDDDLLGDPELEPQGWSKTLNEITVVYKDRDHHFNDYTQVYRSPNNFRITGAPRPETLQRPWITDASIAKAFVTAYGTIQALPFTAGLLHIRREFITTHNLLPGKIITYNSAFYGLSFLLRIMQIDYPADKDAKATLTVQWDRSKWPSLYTPPGFQGPGGFVLGPRGIWQSRITEIPYLLLDRKFLTQVVCLAVKGNVETTGFRIWASFDAGATYQDLKNQNDFGFFGRVNAAIINTDPIVAMKMFGAGIDDLVTQTVPQQQDDTLLLFIDAEVMSVGNVVPQGHGLYRMNILRHRLGTTAQAHAVNAQGFFIFRSKLHLIDNAKFIPGQVVKFKLQPYTHAQDYDLASITPVDYTVVGWAVVSPPTLSPPAGTFVGSVNIRASAEAGMTIRYTSDGTEVNGSSPIFPGGGGKHITSTTTIRARAFASNGRFSGEVIAHYTRTTAAQGQSQCGAPSWSFDGVIGYSAGNLTLTATTVGSTIKYKKNGGSITTYSTPLALVCNLGGDVVEFWATQAGLDDSPHYTLDNTQQDPRGGGHGPPIPP